MKLLSIQDIQTSTKYRLGGYLKNDKGYDPKTKLPVIGGLFCYEIFGRTVKERSETFGIIVLPTIFFHPVFYLYLKQSQRKIIQHILSRKPYYIDLSKNDNRVLLFQTEEEAYEVYGRKVPLSYGLYDLVRYAKQIFETHEKISKIIELHGDNIVIDKLPVIPPVYRNDNPASWSTDKLNDVYGKLIRYSFYFTNQNPKENTEIFAGSYNVLQEEIGNLGELLLERLKGKGGAIRGTMLGRRVDYSGRAVIVPDPKLQVDEIGVPIRILVKIFEPFILRRLTKEENYTVENALRKLEYIHYSNTEELHENEEFKKIIDITIEETKGKIVLVKRDPAINRLSYSGFKVVPVFDSSIHLHPLNTVPFNADFDGDTMAVFAVMTKESQEEAKRMLNPYDSQSTVRPKFVFNKDFARAFRVMTLQTDIQVDEEFVQKIWKKTDYLGYKVSKGVIQIWECLPQKYHKDKKLFEEVVIKEYSKGKSFIDGNAFVYSLIEKIPVEDVIVFLNCATNLLADSMFYFSEAVSILELYAGEIFNKELKKRLEEIKKKYKDEKSQEYIKEANSIREKLAKEILEKLKQNSEIKKYLTIDGFKKVQLLQILLSKGVVESIEQEGAFTFVEENMSTGFTEQSVMVNGQSARLGVGYRALKTSEPGTLSHRITKTLASVQLDTKLEDCGTQRYILLKNVNMDILKRLIGRYIIGDDGKFILLTNENIKNFEGHNIKLRSPIYCRSPKICVRCYGELYKHWSIEKNIGILAGSAVVERIYQETMKVFHLGGVLNVTIVNPVKFSVENLKEDKEILETYFYFDEKDNSITVKGKGDSVSLSISKELYSELIRYLKDISRSEDSIVNEGVLVENLILGVVDEKEPILMIPGECLFKIDEDVQFSIEEDENGDIILTLPKNTRILTVKMSKGGIDLSYTLTYLIIDYGHKLNIKNPETVLSIFYEAIRPLGDVALIHIETILSHMLRNAKQPEKLARLVEPYEAKLYSIPRVMKLDSTILAGAYTNLKQNIFSSFLRPSSTIEEHNLENPILDLIRGEFE